MSGKVLWNSLQAKFNTMKPDSPFGTFHEKLAEALSDWFTSYFLPKQRFKANGTQTNLLGTEIIMSEFNTPPNPLESFVFTTESIYFTKDELITAFKQPGLCWRTVYGLIGTKIATALKIVKCTIPASKVAGTVTSPFMSAHFAFQGYKFFAALKTLDYSEDAIKTKKVTEQIWDKFEDYLIEAINVIPPVIIQVAGTLPTGTFIGTINAKLNI